MRPNNRISMTTQIENFLGTRFVLAFTGDPRELPIAANSFDVAVMLLGDPMVWAVIPDKASKPLTMALSGLDLLHAEAARLGYT